MQVISCTDESQYDEIYTSNFKHMQTQAQQFMEATHTKYVFPYQFCEWQQEHRHEFSYGHRNPYAKYEVKFMDGSSTQVIMTMRQRMGVVSERSKAGVNIDKIGGMGFYSMILAVAEARKALIVPVGVFA